MGDIPPAAFRRPPPPSRCSDGSLSNFHSIRLSSKGNTSMIEGEGVDSNSKEASPTNIDSLPEDILFHLLLLLPADFLYNRARLVCRRWYHIIHSDAFITSQLHHSTYGLLLVSHSSKRGHPIYVTMAQGRPKESVLSYKSRDRILASCNGLVMELDKNGDLCMHVINLATKQPFSFPSFSRQRVSVGRFQSAIAYSVASMEYKVTVPYIDIHTRQSPFYERVGFDILTLGVDKSWRPIQINHLPEDVVPLLVRSPLITEGFMHWGRGNYALTLNLESEIITMSEVPLPPQSHQYSDLDCYYLSTGKYLSLLVACEGFSWEIWEMIPETRKWRKLSHKIELEAQSRRLQQFNEVLNPLGWVKYLEVLAFCFPGRGGGCSFYNLETHEINMIDLLDRSSDDYKGITHRNTLVWLS